MERETYQSAIGERSGQQYDRNGGGVELGMDKVIKWRERVGSLIEKGGELAMTKYVGK